MADQLERLKAAMADRYRIDRELGSGGMATVYLAQDLKHERQVAVKVLRPELAAALGPERFHQEIKIAANLTHPHILPLHDSGDADGFLYYVMPHIEGESLRDRLAHEGELPIGEAVRILRDIVDGLSHAHKHGVVHRDIKPDNVLLSERHALVTDFGVAKAVSEATGAQKLTTEGVALGTPAYMSPEQAVADKHIDHRADIYAVGTLAYELLTGRPPFTGTTPQEVLSAQVTQAPDPVTKYRPTVPPPLEQLVMKCLEKKAADRWQTAEELLPQLEALATPSVGVTPTDIRQVTATPVKRRWLVPAALGSVGALIVLGFLGVQLFKRGPIAITTSNIRAVTSEPGMEWQPVLSPDGSQVAFVAHRNGRQEVVIRSTRSTAAGGELTPTQGLRGSPDQLPAWSPDGEFVRFRKCAGDQCAWREVSRLGGSIRSIDLPSNAAFPSWSPDGSRVAFIAMPDSIFTYSIPDGTSTLLAVQRDVYWALHSPIWSPDGRWLAYVKENPDWPTRFNIWPSSIWIVTADGGEPVRVTSDEFMDVSPAWLDSGHLLFVSNREGPREVYVVEVGPTGPRGELLKVPGVTDPHSISYSIVGGKLAFSKAAVRQNIWSYRLVSGSVSISDGDPVTNDNAIIETHDISPDGRLIAYCSNLRGNMDIYVRPLEGGEPMVVTNSPLDEFWPQWSPDGTEIALWGPVGAAQRAVMVVPANGGTQVRLASAPWYDRNPRWSPSGLEILFRSDRSGRTEAWLVSRAAVGGPWGEATQLTDIGCNYPDWTPDGSGVLCETDEGIALVSREGEVLWRYDVATTGLREISRPSFSWDGSTIYGYGRHEDGSEGIWAIPRGGGDASLVVAYDDPEIGGSQYFSVGPDRLYVTVGEYEVDVWVMDVEVRR